MWNTSECIAMRRCFWRRTKKVILAPTSPSTLSIPFKQWYTSNMFTALKVLSLLDWVERKCCSHHAARFSLKCLTYINSWCAWNSHTTGKWCRGALKCPPMAYTEHKMSKHDETKMTRFWAWIYVVSTTCGDDTNTLNFKRVCTESRPSKPFSQSHHQTEATREHLNVN